MNTIYDQAMRAVSRSDSFLVDLLRHDLTVGRRRLITQGEYEGALGLDDIQTEADFRRHIVECYSDYYHSVPDVAEDRATRRGTYFAACDEPTREDVLMGIPRTLARCRLETSVLIGILRKLITWTDDRPGWFIHLAKGVVIQRKWLL